MGKWEANIETLVMGLDDYKKICETGHSLDLIREQLNKLHPFVKRSDFSLPTRFSQAEKFKTIPPEQTLIAQTDKLGSLQFANDDFFDLLDIHKNDDLLAVKNFKSIRHPDMPKSIYLDLWATISTGLMWNGIICNKGKDGLSYWLSACVFPIAKDNNITNYLAIYKEAPSELSAEAVKLYRRLP